MATQNSINNTLPSGVTITGTANINTSGSAITTIGNGGTGAVNIGNATGNTTISAGNLTITAGNVTLTSGDVIFTSGNLSLPTSGPSTGLIKINGNPYFHNYGVSTAVGSLFVGQNAGNFTLSGADTNYAFGNLALHSLTNGTYNVGIGYQSLTACTSGTQNTAVGAVETLDSLTTGDRNLGVGLGTLHSLTTGTGNIAIGHWQASGTGASGMAYTSSESWNIDIGNFGVLGESNVIRIGTQYNTTYGQNKAFMAGITGVVPASTNISAVLIDSAGQFGSTLNSAAAATASPINFLKSRSGGAITSGDSLGAVNFSGHDGTAYITGSQITSTNSGTVATNRIASNLKFYTHPDSTSASTLRMTIDTTGAVTIAAPDSGTGLTVSGGGISVAGGLTLPTGTNYITSIDTFGRTVGVSGIAVLVDNTGAFGTVASSKRYKDNIVPMGNSSDNVLKLNPVTFIYKHDDSKTMQFGLIAEEVMEVMPSLVVYDKEGLPQTVKYHDLPALLLNEIQKLYKRIEILESKLKEKQ